jgi:hypothetical protein
MLGGREGRLGEDSGLPKVSAAKKGGSGDGPYRGVEGEREVEMGL